MRASRFFITVGFLLLLGAAGLTGYNVWDSMRAGKMADQVLAEIEEENGQITDAATGDLGVDGVDADSEDTEREDGSASLDSVEAQELNQVFPDREMPVETIASYDYIGVLEVPSLGLSLPVMDTWDYSRLRIAPCRYYGSLYTHDLVIAGHNYASHFSPLKYVALGTEVDFIDMFGTRYRYKIVERITLQPGQTEDMVKESDDWDLTLFTCNTGGKSRCTLRCVLM